MMIKMKMIVLKKKVINIMKINVIIRIMMMIVIMMMMMIEKLNGIGNDENGISYKSNGDDEKEEN